jgi:hypothetical protein
VLRTRRALLGYRSVNPGTESIIVIQAVGVKQKKCVSHGFQQFFGGLNFNHLKETPVDSLCINQRGREMFFLEAAPRRHLVEISQPGGALRGWLRIRAFKINRLW